MKIVAVVLFFVCMFVTLKGGIDLIHSRSDGNVPISARTGNIDVVQWDAAHPYLFIMNSDSDEMFYRLRGLGMINDPNDFAQLVVCVIPLMFLLWRPKKASWNFPFVILPVCALLLSVFLTHSRGALLAIIAEAVVAARRRIGIVPALALAGLLFVSAMALQFTGGRDISAGAGEDRTALWGEGLAAFKAHPIFGVGWGQLPNFTADHLTAHNSVVLCASELGLLGLFFWSLFLFPTFRDVLVIGSPKKVNEAMAVEQEEVPFPHPMTAVEELDKGEMNRAGNLLLLSLVGFVVTGWFLSRAFAVTLFLLGGMVEAVYQMTLERGMIAPRMRFSRVFAYSCVLSVGLVAAVYLMVRMAHLGH